MLRDPRKSLGNVVIFCLLFATLAITPTITLDPINPVKMLTMAAFSFAGLGILLATKSNISFQPIKLALVLIGAHTLWLFVVFLISDGEKIQQLFGASGRNTGLITYFSLSILFVISMIVSNPEFIFKFLKISLIVGCTSLLYGIIQIADADPFSWQEIYSPVFGFLGNPNFQSSLLGILGAILFTELFSSKIDLHHKLLHIGYLLITVLVILKTESQQGFLVLLLGAMSAFGIFLLKKSINAALAYLLFSAIGFAGMLFGILNKGPMASILYKESVAYRGDYWRAGWNMTLENPIFGVGLDSYGDWYRRMRTIEGTIRRGPDVVSNAAHNVYLDFASNGGFPLLATYLSLVTLVGISAIRVLMREKRFNSGFVGIFAGWIAFQSQSIISINQIGLAVWGWVLSGLIVGYEINTRDAAPQQEKGGNGLFSKTRSRDLRTGLGLFLGFVVGISVGIPPFLSSAEHISALKRTDLTSVIATADIWPHDPSRMIQVAITLNENNYSPEGLRIILDASRKFPDNYAVWSALYIMKSATDQHQAEALAQMKRLDPLNPTLK